MSDGESSFGIIHYVLTFIFFLMILINILNLLRVTYNMEPVDSNTQTAQDLMYTAVGIGFGGELLIIVFLLFTYMYSSSKNELTISYYDKLMGNTGAESLYAAMRIVTFSILMLISMIISVLCYDAAKYIDKSSSSEDFEKEKARCEDIAETFMIHFIIFTVIQAFIYIYQLCFNNGSIKISPTEIATGKKTK